MSEKTAVLEARVDMRDLASCANFFITSGQRPKTKSELVYMILTSFSITAQKQGAREFQSTEEAMGYMEEQGFGPVNRIKREGRRANIKTLGEVIASERSLEGSTMELGQIAGGNTTETVEDLMRLIKTGVVKP